MSPHLPLSPAVAAKPLCPRTQPHDFLGRSEFAPAFFFLLPASPFGAEEHLPETVSERQLVDFIATLQWRLRRTATFETSLLNPDGPTVRGGVITVEYVAGRPDPDLPQGPQNPDQEDEPCLGYTDEGHKIVGRKEIHVPPSYQPPNRSFQSYPIWTKLTDTKHPC